MPITYNKCTQLPVDKILVMNSKWERSSTVYKKLILQTDSELKTIVAT